MLRVLSGTQIMSDIAKTLSESAKSEGRCSKYITRWLVEKSGSVYRPFDMNEHLSEVIDTIIHRISTYKPRVDDDDYDDEYHEIFLNMVWNETYDMVRVHMTLNIPFCIHFVHYGTLDFMVCDLFNKKLNEIGFQLYTIPEIDQGNDGVGGPDNMMFTLKLMP